MDRPSAMWRRWPPTALAAPLTWWWGLTTDGTVTGVAVISHSETPNVGSKVVDDQSVLDRFAGLTGEITVNSGDNRVDAVSGATTSSKAVTAGVNAAIAAVEARQPVLQGAEEG